MIRTPLDGLEIQGTIVRACVDRNELNETARDSVSSTLQGAQKQSVAVAILTILSIALKCVG